MFQIGDLVVYGVHGVCRITEIQVQRINRVNMEYFVLEPVSQGTGRFFVPSQNEVALSKLRPILSEQEICELLTDDASKQDCWIEDENKRKLRYKELIASGDRSALISMLRVLNLHRTEQMNAGKKFHISDSNFMKDAEKIIFSEFSLVMNIPYEQVADRLNIY